MAERIGGDALRVTRDVGIGATDYPSRITRHTLRISSGEPDFVRRVEELSGEDVFACYQCGKCSAGCPFTSGMDLLPAEVLRLLQLGDERVLSSRSPWVCASCLACEVRCPKGVDIAKVMEALRLLILRKGETGLTWREIPPGVPQIALVGATRKLTP
jgi:heterodisulfide reductase subunit C